MIKLAKFLARQTEFSRREAIELIKAGRVTVNAGVAESGGVSIDPASDSVAINGRTVNRLKQRARVLLYTKPTGEEVSHRTDLPSVFTEIQRRAQATNVKLPKRLLSAGRLDVDSRGLLVLSNDPDTISDLLSFSFERPRRYRCVVQLRQDSDVSQSHLAKLEDGFMLAPFHDRNGLFAESQDLLPMRARCVDREGSAALIDFACVQGRFREVRRVLSQHCNVKVSQLLRTQFARYRLQSLTPGHLTEVHDNDCKLLLPGNIRADGQHPSFDLLRDDEKDFEESFAFYRHVASLESQ